ncbi:MAG: phosphate ABC transporter permease subunit PstC [Dokdonella sp.]
MQDRGFSYVLAITAFLVLIALAGAALSMLWGGRTVLAQEGWGFFFSSDWNPVENHYGALVPIYGTLVTAIIAMIIAVPVSFGIALYLTEVAPPWLRRPVGTAIELLAGIPSIIYGMWGLFVLVPMMTEHVTPWLNDHIGTLPIIGPLFQGPPLGIGMLTAGLVLSIMVIPFISAVMRDVFLTVPSRLKESAYALGSTRWEVVWDVVLPYTRSAVVGGVFLGLGRALGETMAVAYVIGNTVRFSVSLLEPGTTIAALIANDFAEATDTYRSALLLLGFVLFIVTFVVLAAARLMLMQMARREGTT